MRYEDASQAGSVTDGAELIARPDVETLPPNSNGPGMGNAITGAGTNSGAAGADTVANGPGTIVELQGAGGAATPSGGGLQAAGQYGSLTMGTDGSYSYVRDGGSPDGVQDVFQYTLADAAGARSSTTLTVEIPRIIDQQAVVNLPAGVEMSDIRVVGRDLVIQMPDGTQMVIPGGAVFVPELSIGDVVVPPSNLAALLIDSEPQPAAGPPQSSGGNFADDVPPLDPGVPLGDLIPPTELDYSPPDFQEVFDLVDREPTIIIITPDNPAGAVNATASVDESGLPERGNEPEGTLEPQNIETTTGTIRFTAEDGLSSITINGTAITAVGQQIQGANGVLTITSINLATGEIGYSYTVTDNTTDGVNDFDDFIVVVTDDDGDVATGTLRINIADDEPIARDDVDSVDLQANAATGNVMTGVGTNAGTASGDTVGADDATLTAIEGEGGSDSSFDSNGNLVVDGEYGTLTIDAEGNYTYVPFDNAPGGTEDVFTYTLTDGDGDVITATLTIINPDQTPTAGSNPVVQLDDDALAGGNPGGTGDDPNSVNATGTLSGAGGDGDLTFDLLTTGAPDGFTYVDGPNGSILVQQVQDGVTVTVLTITVDAETGAYTVVQNANILHPNAQNENNVVFTINYTVTDSDGDTVASSLTVNVDDDTPLAANDTDTLGENDSTAEGNVITGAGTNEGTGNADQPGADGFAGITALVGANSSDSNPSGGFTVQGEFGALVMDADGNYTYTRDPNAIEGGNDVFTYTYVDGDGDTVTATLTIVVPNIDTTPDVPENTVVLVDDDDVGSGGNAGGTGDDDPLNTTGSVAAIGGDGTITYALSEDGAPTGFNYDLQPNGDLHILQGTTHVLTVTLDQSGNYTVTQVAPIEHADGDDENNLVDQLVVTFSATDEDGSVDEGTLTIDVDDDTPINFLPQPLNDTNASTPTTQDNALVNDGTAVATNPIHDTNNDGVGENFIGADGFGSLLFTTTGHTNGELLRDADGNPLTSGGKAVYVVGYGTNTLTAYVESGANAGYQAGEDTAVVFTLTLNEGAGNGANSTYTIDFDLPLDDGSGIVLSNFSKAPAGQNEWIGVDSDGNAINDDNNDSPDILLTPTNAGGTINTSATDIGNGNQWIDDGEGIRIDFVTDVRYGSGDEKDAAGYTFDGHYDVTGTSFKVMQTLGGGDAAIRIAAYNDSDTGTLTDLGGTLVPIDESSIVVTGDATYTIVDMGDGTFVITGLNAGATVSFDTGGAAYNAITITSADGVSNPSTPDPADTFSGADFAVGAFGFFTAAAGENIDLDFDVTATDGDGDTSTGQIDITLVPAGTTVTSTSTSMTMSTESQSQSNETSMSATLVASNDNGDNSKTYIAGNQAALMGVIAAAGLEMSGKIADVRAMLEDIRGDAAHAGGGKQAALVNVEADGGQAQSLSVAALDATDPAVSEMAEARSNNASAEIGRARLDAVNDDAGPAVSALAGGTQSSGAFDASAITAAAVAMPSAEMVAALDAAVSEFAAPAGASVAKTQEVGRILADALQGGDGPDIGALLAAATGGGGKAAALDTLASLQGGSVPDGHNGHMGAFANGHGVISVDALAFHHDAPPAA